MKTNPRFSIRVVGTVANEGCAGSTKDTDTGGSSDRAIELSDPNVTLLERVTEPAEEVLRNDRGSSSSLDDAFTWRRVKSPSLGSQARPSTANATASRATSALVPAIF